MPNRPDGTDEKNVHYFPHFFIHFRLVKSTEELYVNTVSEKSFYIVISFINISF